MRNYNSLIDRYPGADGMKTGFICASGYNVVASATRNGRRLIAVVLGSYSGAVRAQKAAQLLERGFNSGGLSWLTPSLGTVDALAPIDAQPPNLREEMCGGHRRKPPSEENEEEPEDAAAHGQRRDSGGSQAFMLSSLKPAERQIRARASGRDDAADRGFHRPGRPSGHGGQTASAAPKKKKASPRPKALKKPKTSEAPRRRQDRQACQAAAKHPSRKSARRRNERARATR